LNKTDKELCEQAATLRAEAHGLLHGEGLLDLLRAHGPTYVVGSYTLDLMTWADVDICVQLPDEKDIPAFFEIGKRIANEFQTLKMTFSNQFLRTDVPFDRGLYWGIRLLHAGRTFKIDLWGHGEDGYRDEVKEFKALRQSLAGAGRMAILRIKDTICREKEYGPVISSVHVYRAVAEQGVETVDGFRNWLRDEGIVE
jgi:hypothetical protein